MQDQQLSNADQGVPREAALVGRISGTVRSGGSAGVEDGVGSVAGPRCSVPIVTWCREDLVAGALPVGE